MPGRSPINVQDGDGVGWLDVECQHRRQFIQQTVEEFIF
jgi:hypothetical protein